MCWVFWNFVVEVELVVRNRIPHLIRARRRLFCQKDLVSYWSSTNKPSRMLQYLCQTCWVRFQRVLFPVHLCGEVVRYVRWIILWSTSNVMGFFICT
jgi:hypothetical protein